MYQFCASKIYHQDLAGTFGIMSILHIIKYVFMSNFITELPIIITDRFPPCLPRLNGPSVLGEKVR